MRLIAAALGLVLIAAISHTALGQTANLQVSAQVDASCTVTGGTLAFGTYTATAGTAAESETDISYSCSPGTNISLSLGPGAHPQGENRAMEGPGGATLPYGLYQDDAGAVAWGEGAEALLISDTPAGPQAVTVYGEIAAGQEVAPGAYTDTVLITLAIQ